MKLQLPRLTYDVDCAPIHYPGIVVKFMLNLPYDGHEYPWEAVENDPKWDAIEDAEERTAKREAAVAAARAKVLRKEPWASEWFYYLGRVIESVTFPAEMVAGDELETVEIPDAKAIYDLMYTEGFDQRIIVWAADQYSQYRQQWLEAEVKN